MLRACLGSLLQAISLYGWSINQKRCDKEGGVFLWHVIGCTFALYSAYECQITPIKQKILLHLDAAVELAKLPLWTDLWRLHHRKPTRELEHMLQHLDTTGAFCKCVRGYSLPRAALRLPVPPSVQDLALDQLSLDGASAHDTPSPSMESPEEALPLALDTSEIERLHNEYIAAMSSFRISTKEGKAAGQRRRAAVLFNMPAATKQKELTGFVQSLHRVLQGSDNTEPDEPRDHPSIESNRLLHDEAALAAILQADLESELLDDDTDMLTKGANHTEENDRSNAPCDANIVANAPDGIVETSTGQEQAKTTTYAPVHAEIRTELASDDNDDEDGDDGWAQDIENELVASNPAAQAEVAPSTADPSNILPVVELSLSSSTSSEDDDDAFEAELEASVLARQAVPSAQQGPSTSSTPSQSTQVSKRSAPPPRDPTRGRPSSCSSLDGTNNLTVQPIDPNVATWTAQEALQSKSNVVTASLNLDTEVFALPALSSSSDSSDNALDELEQEILAASAKLRPADNARETLDKPQLNRPTAAATTNTAKYTQPTSRAEPRPTPQYSHLFNETQCDLPPKISPLLGH
ncbi:hypothetical protein, variant [Aphanomyces invadans]|nr:hypothetical protein, variant [Aphanomyces invadans]ETW00308.1 hypothetical protein, variant [Aphanomyces invadans]|eukprot:XP_008871333.1 hypothetical protein, variant [Aphanomyces invadans]